MAIKIRPLRDRLIVERIEETEQMVGGIIIPDTAKEKPQQGKVLAVGKGKVAGRRHRHPGRRQGRRQGALWQVLRSGDRAGWHRLLHHARG